MTRNANNYRLPKVRLEKSKQVFMYAGAGFFNKLPTEIKNLSGTKNFYKELQKWLTQKVIYSVEDDWHVEGQSVV